MGVSTDVDGTAAKVAHELGIPWPSADQRLLHQAADAFDAASSALDRERDVCTATVRRVTASNTGGGMEQFSAFWTRYDGADAALPATSSACRQMASALRQYADEVQRAKDSIRHQVEIAGAALVVGTGAALFTFGASEAAAATVAVAIADCAASVGLALSATVTALVSTALVGAVFGVLESVAVDALVVQPLSLALDEQEHYRFGELLHAAESGGVGGTFAGAARGLLTRLPGLAGSVEAAGLPRTAAALDGVSALQNRTAGRLASGSVLGAGGSEVVSGGHASRFDVVLGTVGGVSGPPGRRRTLGKGNRPDGSWSEDARSLTREQNALVTRSYALQLGREPRITADLQRVARDTTGALAGLTTRVKGADSFRRKVIMDAGAEGDVARALTDIRDVVRYTFELPPATYARDLNRVTGELLARGYGSMPDKFKVRWSEPGSYKGVNSSWTDPRSGQVFEVQFHTRESRQAKETDHAVYDEMHRPGLTEGQLSDLRAKQHRVFGAVPVPPDLHLLVVPGAQVPK